MRASVLFSLVLAAACANDGTKQRHFDSAARHLEAKRYAEAIVEYRNALRADENWGEARRKLGDAYAANGQPERALREYVLAADLLPHDAEAQTTAATYLLLGDQFEDAASRARRALEIAPKNIDARIVLANALAGVRDLEGALDQLRQAIAADPSRSQPYTALARLHVVQGKNAEAMSAYEAALRLEPTSIPAHLALGNFLWSRGDVEGAGRTLARAYELDPTLLVTNRVLATFYLAADRSGEAERHVAFVAKASDTPADRLALADLYIMQKRFDEARRLLQRLSDEPAMAAAVETRLARVDDLEGHVTAADDRLDRVLGREPHNTAALLLRAQRSLARAHWTAALEDANAAIASNARLVEPYYVRAAAELRLRRPADAMRSYAEIARLRPAAVDAKVALSRLHLARNQIDSAVLYAEEALSIAPADVDARLALARAWVARGDDARAASEVREILVASPRSAEAHALTASLWLKQGDLAAARQAFERVLQLNPQSSEALTALTKLDVREAKFAVARARLDAALQAAPDDADITALAAQAAFAAGDRIAADTLLRQCIARDSLQLTCFGYLASLYRSEQRLDVLVREFDERARRERNPVGDMLVAAVAVHTAGDLADAERRYEAILKRDPRAALAANNLAALYVERGTNLLYAEQLALSAAEQVPTNGNVFDTLGSVYAKRGWHPSAIRYFRHAVALEPGNALFHYHLGQAYAASDDRERARESFQTAVRLNANFSAAREALTSLTH